MRIQLGAHLYSLIRLYMLDKVLRRMRRENTHDYINFMVKLTSALHQPTLQSATSATETVGRTAAHRTTARITATHTEPKLLLGVSCAVREELLTRLNTDILQDFQSGSLDLAENVAERGHNASTADKAVELLGRRRWGKGSTDDVLLGQNSLNNSRAPPNGFEKSRVRRDDEELGRDAIKTRVVEDRKVELEREVTYQSGALTRL